MQESTVVREADTACGNIRATELLLVTANVGSLFEDPQRLLQPWLDEFLQTINNLAPQFIALHLQEVGGKTYEKSMEYVQEFIKRLCEASNICEYSCIRIYMDEDYNSAEHFTALGNIYFAHKQLTSAKLWNFLTHSWEDATDKNIYSGNIEAIATKEKSKFPQHFFPECKWSRKGFMRTRWELNGTVMDLVNIHLFHDASNLAACEEFPSVYCKTRRRALVHTLERFHLDNKNGLVPFFVFGDFNFRCDAEGVIKELTENLTTHRVHNSKHDSTKVHYRNSDGNNVLTVGKKEFIHADHQLKFKETWFKKYDRELDALSEVLFEYPIEFPPTYPYEEDPEMPTDYMSTRCPAWCDRIVMSLPAKQIILDEPKIANKSPKNPYYIIGENVCMGDHKPIYLSIKLKPNQGTYDCCKCHTINANANKSTSHIQSALSIDAATIYCPISSQVYVDVLAECAKLNKLKLCAKNQLKYAQNGKHSTAEASSTDNVLPQASHSSNDLLLHALKHPQVSINIIDSDNINVCMCTPPNNNDAATNCGLDGSTVCPVCLNMIKQQPLEHRCTLISKRLLLSNEIIVNRIDTHYLNTQYDCSQRRHEPYTPESAESHSPYTELESTTTTTSSNSRSPSARHDDAMQQQQPLATDIANNKESPLLQKQSFKADMLLDVIETQRRGIVTPGQLKSRLEDLQRRSYHNLNDAHCLGNNTLNVHDDDNDDDAADSVGGDVDNVDKICAARLLKKHKCSCLPQCCKIN